MEPLLVLISVTPLLVAAGAVGVHALRPWPVAVRGGLAAVFAVTGLAHFDLPAGMRAELVGIVPPGLPAPDLLVTITGVLELAGAAGLLWTRTTPLASAGLAALLVAVFPANITQAVEDPAARFDEQLGPRSVLQIVFLAATLVVLRHGYGAGRADRVTERR